MTYQQASEMLRGKPRKKIVNHTYLYEYQDAIALRLHATDILVFYRDGRTAYNSGGWHTVTTKQRMNAYGPARVHSLKGCWFIDGYRFYDGVTVIGERVIDVRTPVAA